MGCQSSVPEEEIDDAIKYENEDIENEDLRPKQNVSPSVIVNNLKTTTEHLSAGNDIQDKEISASVIKLEDNYMFLRGKDRNFRGLDQKTEGEWIEPFEFIWMGDPQIGFDNEEQEKMNMKLTVDFINERFEERSIKFVIVCGDHTHNFENIWSKKESLEVNREKRKSQLKSYKDIWRLLNPNIPLVCVCGNHDVGNAPTEQTIRLYTEEFGDDYLAFWAGGVKFLVVNSQLVQQPEKSGNLALEQEDWFDKELNKDECKKIVFAHIPPFCWNFEENDTNFNWPKVRRKKWLDKMVDAGVRNMYCAHYHRRAGGTYRNLKVMITGAVGTSIQTKDIPKDIEGDELREANFKISFEGFGGLNAEPEISGLYVVNVEKEGVSEKWMSIADINKETGNKYA